MSDATELVEQAPVQDRDLLLRLSLYFDAFEQRLRQGEGWFIFNADGKRGKRISTFIERRLDDVGGDVDACMMPWRDFALSAYVREVGLPELAPKVRSDEGNTGCGASTNSLAMSPSMSGTDANRPSCWW